jgi:hypothetical protein
MMVLIFPLSEPAFRDRERQGAIMKQLAINRPEPNEYSPYSGKYISLIETDNIVKTLTDQAQDTASLLSSRSERDGDLRYAPEKWTVKGVVGHVCDTERIFAYRALRISRNDQTPIEGFEQDDYVRYGPFAHCRLADLVAEFRDVRRATVSLFRSLDEAAWMRCGVANKNEVSVRALAYIIAGHELHHRRILEERYFVAG